MKQRGPGHNSLKPPGVEPLTKTTLAIQALRSAILRGEIEPDAHLTVGRLAEQLGMSPTPVREAIRTLQAEGLINHKPHHSLSIGGAGLSPKDVHDIYQIRAMLESLATRLAVPRLTDADLEALAALVKSMREALERGDLDQVNRLNADWHLKLYSAADNNILLDVVLRLWGKFVMGVSWIMPGHAERSMQQHDALMEAVQRRDGETAARLMEIHIQSGEETALDYFRTRSGGSK